MKLFQTFISVISLVVATTLAATPEIRSPAEGSIINPGASFNFDYQSIADYGTSSYNTTVWLFTKSPQEIKSMEDWASGYFFGRFGFSNYPGNPSPKNLAPSQLVMPDFSKLGGGFGVGKTTSNATFHFVVLEEYLNGESNVGYRVNLVSNAILYNVTV
ncbi:hypothetical protein BDQ17DRAFT_1419694 [Cyathus striatus]|nr:hypothetical protein BDQ17DRAFT_1419694 [Cyathus striatus]